MKIFLHTTCTHTLPRFYQYLKKLVIHLQYGTCMYSLQLCSFPMNFCDGVVSFSDSMTWNWNMIQTPWHGTETWYSLHDTELKHDTVSMTWNWNMIQSQWHGSETWYSLSEDKTNYHGWHDTYNYCTFMRKSICSSVQQLYCKGNPIFLSLSWCQEPSTL